MGPVHHSQTNGAARQFDAASLPNERDLAEFLTSISAVFFVLDNEWRLTYVSPIALDLLGMVSTPVGSSVWDAFPGLEHSTAGEHYRRAFQTGAPISFEEYYPPPIDTLYEVLVHPTSTGLWVYFRDIGAERAAREALAQATQYDALLLEVTSSLVGTLDAEKGVAQLARIIVPAIGDWCIVTLVDHTLVGSPLEQRRSLRDIASWHVDHEMRPWVERYADARISSLKDSSFVFQALKSGEPVVIGTDATDAVAAALEPGTAQDLLRRLNPSSCVVMPVKGRGRTIGLITVFRSLRRRPFSGRDVEVLQDIAVRAGLALESAQVFARQRELAEGLQRSMLTAPPEPKDFCVAVRYKPASEIAQVGGDWYDVFVQRSGITNIVIGDVVGHDTAAAAAMGQLRALLRGIAVATDETPARVLSLVDEAMSLLGVETTASVVIARFEQAQDKYGLPTIALRFSNAGHPPPLLVKLEPEGEPTVLDSGSSDLILGLGPNADRAEFSVPFPPGIAVFLYTDGLIERRNESLDVGIERLRAVLHDLSGTDLERLCDQVLERMVPEGHEDDVAVVALRLRDRGSASIGLNDIEVHTGIRRAISDEQKGDR